MPPTEQFSKGDEVWARLGASADFAAGRVAELTVDGVVVEVTATSEKHSLAKENVFRANPGAGDVSDLTALLALNEATMLDALRQRLLVVVDLHLRGGDAHVPQPARAAARAVHRGGAAAREGGGRPRPAARAAPVRAGRARLPAAARRRPLAVARGVGRERRGQDGGEQDLHGVPRLAHRGRRRRRRRRRRRGGGADDARAAGQPGARGVGECEDGATRRASANLRFKGEVRLLEKEEVCCRRRRRRGPVAAMPPGRRRRGPASTRRTSCASRSAGRGRQATRVAADRVAIGGGGGGGGGGGSSKAPTPRWWW